MNVSLKRTYRSKNGNPTFVYKVTGNASDLEAYKDAQGEYHRTDDEGHPLWFTTRCIGPNGKLIITTNGNIVPDMSAFDQAASIASQYGGNFGQELARMSAAAILGNSVPQADASAPATPSTPTADAEVVEDELVHDDEDDDSIE